jgi:hypothetical protein
VKLVSFGGAFFILPGERGVVAKEGLWMVMHCALIALVSYLSYYQFLARGYIQVLKGKRGCIEHRPKTSVHLII